jgi:hypothetical protein
MAACQDAGLASCSSGSAFLGVASVSTTLCGRACRAAKGIPAPSCSLPWLGLLISECNHPLNN